MQIDIRQATLDDITDVRYVGICAWPPTYGPIYGPKYVVDGLDEYWSDAAIRNDITAGQIDVAVIDGRCVGVSQVAPLDSDLVLWKLYVLPEFQRAGVGRRLMDAAKERARAQGCDLLTEYASRNARVGQFYRRQGFTETDDPWGGSDAVWMRYHE